MEKKNQVLMTVLGVFALVIVTVGVSYAFFNYTRTGTSTNTITTGTTPITFGFSNEAAAIALTDATPLTDTQGQALTPYTFKVAGTMPTNSTVNYTIYAINDTTAYLADNAGLTALADSAVKGQLKKNGTEVWTGTFDTVFGGATEKVLYANPAISTGTANTTIDDSYELRIWLASSVSGGNIDANDQGTGTIDDGDNYTSDGQTITSNTANKAYSLKLKVVASAVAQ